MIDATNGNGNGNGEKRIEAIARSIQLQGYARLSMVIWPPVITIVIAVAAWFFSGLSSDVRALNTRLSEYITVDTVAGQVRATKITEHDRRLGIVEGRVFGYTPAPLLPTIP